ncbi:LysR family transcriptional regulator [Marinobacterium nitratireducens]|uniref:LysR family transcriptional regulator n=1 Tax=Marinobacterium nitratireducens TaxID=518897 RepID=A0A917ZPJ7_9GAMM|nr:LysR family transcriptional regulator [Marinobacterium nitratireducens]GGO86641.1 LysR family transcriptional regulator [Marinobacterium nitratireducens]
MPAQISLEALKVLDAIDRHGSFAAAAEALYRVPSAITYTVQRLEEEHDIKVFEKQGRRMVLTPVGRMLLQHGRQILEATESLAEMAQRMAHGWEAQLTIAINGIFPIELIFPLLRRFQKVQPDIHLALRYETLAGTWDCLHEGRADLVIGAPGLPPQGRSYDTLPLPLMPEGAFCYVAAPDHPVCALEQPVKRDVLRRFTSVVIPDSSKRLPALTYGLVESQSRLFVPDMDAKLKAHLAGLGIGYLPRFRAAPYLASGELREIAVELVRTDHSHYIAWHSSNRGRALQWFVEALREHNPYAELLAESLR